MGIFGSSPQKKLEKARALKAGGRLFDALSLFRELEERPEKLSGGEQSEVRVGLRACREAMITLRLEEAEALRQAGDLSGARDRCRTAQDLAGDDLESPAIDEMVRRIDAPRRTLARSAEIEDSLESDLPEPAGDEPAPTPVDRPQAEEPEPSDAELFGENGEALFELHLETLEPETATYFRGLGRTFHHGYLALLQGAGRRSLEFFSQLPIEALADPRVALEHAHALLLAGRTEDALAELEGLETSEAALQEETARRLEARQLYLRVEALRVLGRYEEAVDWARRLCEEAGGSVATEALLAWTLIEAGRAEEAHERLQRLMHPEHPLDELVLPAAAAAGALEMFEEEIVLLEGLIQRRILHSAAMQEEIDFPVAAGRRLLELYEQEGGETEAERGLLLHLIDHDPGRAEEYREQLLALEQE